LSEVNGAIKMSIFLKLLLKHQVRSSPAKFDRNYQVKGMTMIELLVGTIIAFIVITPLMGMVIGLLNDDQRESAKANTEEEIQSALDYIGEDVSQALYIYVTKKEETDSSGNKTTTDEIKSLKDNGFLPTDGTPVLVFWKRKLVEDSVPVDTTKQPKDCTPTTCNDTYVLSLVSYHLLEEDTNPIWCQPLSEAKGCPSRIVRYEISDGLAKSDGTYYTKDDLGTDENPNLRSYWKGSKDSLPYNPNFTLSDPLKNVTDAPKITVKDSTGKETEVIDTTKIAGITQTVLVNYIQDFKLDDSSTNNLAKLTIQANALRRNDAKADCTKNPNSPYCPKSSVQLRGLSGLGN
jgi:type II secretory pathway pseudopilin PulG